MTRRWSSARTPPSPGPGQRCPGPVRGSWRRPPSPTTATPVQEPAPEVTCLDLQLAQVAQDTIQQAGVCSSRSDDASGAGRAQVLDRSWTVVSQGPAPGVLIGEGDVVLSVVRTGEPNSC
jgi:hypothetical protein